MNWFDLLVIILGVLAVIDGIRRGFVIQILELGTFVISIWVALRCYPNLADWLVNRYQTSPLVAKPVAFLGLWLLIEGVTFLVLWLIGRLIPDSVKQARLNHLAGVIPATIRTVVYLGVGLTILLHLPLPADINASIKGSWAGPRLIYSTSSITAWLERSLGRTFGETFSFLTTSTEGIGYRIPAVTDSTKLQVESTLEVQMLVLINIERVNAGLKPLVLDEQAQAVARDHSQDMWQEGYFDHLDSEGKGVGERFQTAGVTFKIAGENLALAPTLLIAHEGLMHSQSHRENILHPDFHRVGIGIISAGANGLMVTQNFRD